MSQTMVVNIRKVKCDVFIGRPELYGNPFKIGIDGTREEVIQKYKDWLLGLKFHYLEQERRRMIILTLSYLKGKRLGCYCKPKACHGDVLVELVEDYNNARKTLFKNW